ncbi:hypothetical protein [Oceanobacillus sojae]
MNEYAVLLYYEVELFTKVIVQAAIGDSFFVQSFIIWERRGHDQCQNES